CARPLRSRVRPIVSRPVRRRQGDVGGGQRVQDHLSEAAGQGARKLYARSFGRNVYFRSAGEASRLRKLRTRPRGLRARPARSAQTGGLNACGAARPRAATIMQTTVQDAFALAARHEAGGRPADARAIYEKILAAMPE